MGSTAFLSDLGHFCWSEEFSAATADVMHRMFWLKTNLGFLEERKKDSTLGCFAVALDLRKEWLLMLGMIRATDAREGRSDVPSVPPHREV